MRKGLAFYLLFLGILFLSICHLCQTEITPLDTREIKGFEFIPQPDDITCGPTSALMLMRRYGNRATFAQIESRARTKWLDYKGVPVGMTSPDYLAQGMKKLGLSVHLEHGSLSKLRQWISAERPFIVLLRSGKMTWHYVVVIGYNVTSIVVADPSSGNREIMDIDDFLMAWRFVGDMDGRKIADPCSWCSGTGRWLPWNLGPLSICEACEGSGLQPDYLGFLVRTIDIYPLTAIVPVESLAK